MSIDLHFWRSRERGREREKLRYSVRDPSIKHQGLRIKDDTFGLPSVSSRQYHEFIEICCANKKTNFIESKFIKPLFCSGSYIPYSWSTYGLYFCH